MFDQEELVRLNAAVGLTIAHLGSQKRFTDPEFSAYAELQQKICGMIAESPDDQE